MENPLKYSTRQSRARALVIAVVVIVALVISYALYR